MTSFKIYPGQRNAIYTICNIHYSAIPTTPTKILKSYKRKGHDYMLIDSPMFILSTVVYVLGGGRWQIMCQSTGHMLGDGETSMNQTN